MNSNLFILAGLVILSAIFSGSETALVSVTNSKVSELVSNKAHNSKVLQKLKKDPHKLLITVLIGNNIVNIGASAYAALIFTEMYGSSGLGLATGIMTFLILVFGEIVPKSFAHQHAAGVALFMARPIYLLLLLLFPLVWFFEKIVDAVHNLLGSKKRHTVTEGEIVAMLRIGTQEGSIEKSERDFIENVLEFNDIEVEEVMTPRVNIEALDSEMTIQEAVEMAIRYSHSRLPVYKQSMDHVVGIISIKELLRFYDECPGNKKLKNLNIPLPLEVPYSKKINKLFKEFQRKHRHIALVIDEHGGTAGLVTMEDLLEELVGEIVDEFDVDIEPIHVISRTTIRVNGSTLIEDVNDFFKIAFGKNERDTVNTMIVDHLHRFPREGETIAFPRFKVKILGMEKNIINTVEIKKRTIRKPKK